MPTTKKSPEPSSSQIPGPISSPPSTNKSSSSPSSQPSSSASLASLLEGDAGSAGPFVDIPQSTLPYTPDHTPRKTRTIKKLDPTDSSAVDPEEREEQFDSVSQSSGASADSDAVSQLLDALQLFQSRGIEPKIDWYLKNDEYEKLLDFSRQDPSRLLDSLRYNWTASPTSADRGHIELRMPTLFHDVLAQLFQELLLRGFLDLLIELPPGVTLTCFGSQEVKLDLSPFKEAGSSSTAKTGEKKGKMDKKEPDGSIGYTRSPKPRRIAAILLVAFSQRADRARKEAQEYLLGAKGAVNMVIIIKLGYLRPPAKQPIKARSAMYCVAYLERVDDDVEFQITDRCRVSEREKLSTLGKTPRRFAGPNTECKGRKVDAGLVELCIFRFP